MTTCSDIFSSSSIHGLKEAFERKRYRAERIIWVSLLLASTFVTTYLIYQSWRKFQDNPIVVTIERNYNEWKIPMPANIVCPEKVNVSDFSTIIEKKFGQVDEEKEEYYKTFLFDLANLDGSSMSKMLKYTNDTCLANLNLPDLQEQARRPPKIAVQKVGTRTSYKGQFLRTPRGPCFAYNTALPTIASKGYDYAEERILNNTIESSSEQLYFAVVNPSWGTKIFLNSPYEFPDMVHNYLVYLQDEDLNTLAYSLDLQSTVSSPRLKRLTVHQRNCLFRQERKLDVSYIYTRVACKMQCKYQKLMRHCNCSPLTFYNTGKYKPCDVKGLACFGQNQAMLASKKECQCYAGCEEEHFDTSLVAPVWYPRPTVVYLMNTFPTTRYMRDVIFGDLEMLVSFGGLGTLFFGGSLLSFVELIYFCVVKLVFAMESDTGQDMVPERISRREAFLKRLKVLERRVAARQLSIPSPLMQLHVQEEELVMETALSSTSHKIIRRIVVVSTNLGLLLKEYLKFSTVHGVKHFLEAPRVWLRILWVVIWITFATCALLTAKSLGYKYFYSSVVYEMEENNFTWNVTAPAFGFCSAEKDKDWTKPPCNEMFRRCTINDVPFDCCSCVHVFPSEVPGCYVMASRQTGDLCSGVWMMYNRTYELSVTVVWYSKIWLVYILSNYDVPLRRGFGSSFVAEYKSVARYRSVAYLVTDEVASDDVRKVPVKSRKCRFPDENEGMRVFKYYSYSACIAQCRVEEKMRLCNCTDSLVGYNTEDQKLCDKKGIDCLKDNEDKLEPVNTAEFRVYGLNCNCPLSCVQKAVSLIGSTGGTSVEMGDNITLTSTMILSTTRRRMRVVRGILDIAVSIGGVFGLFLGASLMSLVEILYYILVRPFFVTDKNARKK